MRLMFALRGDRPQGVAVACAAGPDWRGAHRPCEGSGHDDAPTPKGRGAAHYSSYSPIFFAYKVISVSTVTFRPAAGVCLVTTQLRSYTWKRFCPVASLSFRM